MPVHERWQRSRTVAQASSKMSVAEGSDKDALRYGLRAARLFPYDQPMARCTAPVRGHRSAAAAAECPACGSRYGGYRSYGSYPSYSSSSYRSSSSPSYASSGGSGGGSSGGSARPRWSPVGSMVAYTPAEVRALTPVRETVEKLAVQPERRDYFLCHAWDDRAGAAKELHDQLESRGVSVWFSEKDVALGTPLLREIIKAWRSRGSASCW